MVLTVCFILIDIVLARLVLSTSYVTRTGLILKCMYMVLFVAFNLTLVLNIHMLW